MKRSIAILMFEGAEELDYAGPWEILTFFRDVEHGDCDVFLVSEHGGEVKSAKGLRVLTDFSYESAPKANILLVPGGVAVFTEENNPKTIAYIKRASEDAEVTTSVCTGAFLLEKAGLLTGRRATTHWAFIDRLRALGTVTVISGQRFVDDGNIITSAGVSAGIDMALYLLGRTWSPEQARSVQKGVEYFPDPPFQDIPIPTN
jgi:transcriptional regulator GlxA family with amidase domain